MDFEHQLDRQSASIVAAIEARGALVCAPGLEELVMPPGLGRMLAAALALEPAAGGADTLERHYLELMPTLRVAQLMARDEPAHTFFHTPLRWSALPRLSANLGRFLALSNAARVDTGWLAGSMAALEGRYTTLAELYTATHFGRLMPLLYGAPADLASYAAEVVTDDVEGVFEVIDRRLSAPILHELCHFSTDRSPLHPPYLDECVAGYLGVYLDDAFAYPAAGMDNAIMGAPWFAQVGQALVGYVGCVFRVVRAQSGASGWGEVLGESMLDACERVGWARHLRHRAPHFLDGNTTPMPWLKLFWAARAGLDPAALDLEALEELVAGELPAFEVGLWDLLGLRDGLRAMCLRSMVVDGSWRVRWADGPTAITLDFLACTITGGADGLCYGIAPPLGGAFRAAGLGRVAVRVCEVERLFRVIARGEVAELERLAGLT